MKKKLILSTIVLCFSLSFYAMQQFNEKLWIRINGMPSMNKIVFIINSTDEFSRAEIVDLLIEGARKYKVDLKTAYYSNGVFNAYVLLNDQESIFNKVPLIKKSEFDFMTPNQDVYISTDKSDPNSAGYFYTVFPTGVSLAQYHSFHELAYGDAQLFGWYNASSNDIEQAKAFTQYLEEKLPNNVQVGKGSSYSETKDVKTRNEILLIAFVLFLLLLLLEVSKNMKEISLRKSFGEGVVRIIFDLFKPFFITTIISALLTFIISYWVLIRTFNRYTVEYIIQLGFYFIVVVVLTSILLFILGLVVFMISPISIIKNRNINQTISNFNFVLKIIFIIFLFPQILGYANYAIDKSMSLVDYIKYKDVITSNVSRRGWNPNSSFAGNQQELTKQSMIYSAYAFENSDFYLEYNEQKLPNIMTPDSKKYINYVYIKMTKDYLKYYPIDFAKIDLKSIDKPVIIVNRDRRRTIGFTYSSICKECKIIVTSSDYRIPDFAGMFQGSYLNPVIVVYPSINMIQFRSSDNLYYHSENPDEAIQKRDELINYFGNTWIFTNQESSIRRTITELSITTYYANIVFLQSLAVLLLIILHGITVLYDLNKKEIAIHYLAGYSFLQRSGYIVMQDALLFFLLWTNLVIQKFPIMEALAYSLGVVLFNLIITSIHLLRNEKKQAIDAIKNG